MIYSHTGDIGDIIYSLALAKYTGCDHYILCQTRGPQRNMINQAAFDFIAPLLKNQSYISNTIFHKDLYPTKGNEFRKWLRWFNIAESHFYAFGHAKEDTLNFIRRNTWIEAEPKKIKRILVSKTGRYVNNNLNFDLLKDFHKDDLGFIGTEREYLDFQDYSKIKLDHVKIGSMLEMAEVIAGAELMVCNPSSPCAVSQSAGTPTIILCRPENVAQISLQKEKSLILSDSVDEYKLWMFLNKYSI